MFCKKYKGDKMNINVPVLEFDTIITEAKILTSNSVGSQLLLVTKTILVVLTL